MMLLLKASLVLICLLAFYKIFLEKESFFSANRYYLLSCLILTFVLPFIVLPKLIDQQGYFHDLFKISTEPSSSLSFKEPQNFLSSDHLDKAIILQNEPTDLIEYAPLIKNSEKFINYSESNVSAIGTNEKDFSFWIFWMYIFGAAVLAINLVAQIASVFLKVHRNKDQIEDEGAIIVNLQGEVAPCSFFKYIFINPASYDYATYEQIIDHERIHVDKWHSLDLILSEIAIIILWFNPFAWLLRREVEKNLEYQTDDLLIKNEVTLRQNYQMQLLNIACPTRPLAITTNYNQSLIKQRILKMNARKSNKFQYWKYAFSIPLLFVLLLLLNRPSTAASLSEMLPSEIDDAMESMTEIAMDQLEFPEEIPEEEIPEILDPIMDEPIEEIEAMSDAEISVPNASMPDADCREFEKAVADGNLTRVKEILKTLDPDCLKIKNSDQDNLKSVKSLIQDFQPAKENPTLLPEDSDLVCENLKAAVHTWNKEEVRRILLHDDLSCFKGENTELYKDIALVKGLMSYGAGMTLEGNGKINISGIGFIIDVTDVEAHDCNDPNYLKLAAAIKARDIINIEYLLTTTSLTCPFNTDGVTNDFIFIKELMNYQPEFLFPDKNTLRINGAGVQINIFNDEIHTTKISASNISVVDENEIEHFDLLEFYHGNVDDTNIGEYHVDSNLDEHSWSCSDLLEAVRKSDFERVLKILEHLDPDCFQGESTTITNEQGTIITYSHVTTPLIAAVRNGNTDVLIYLIENDADVNFRFDGNETALIEAVKTDNLEIAKVLLEFGANINWKDLDNMTALDYARRNKNIPLIKFLQSKGAKTNKYSSNEKSNMTPPLSKPKYKALWKYLC